MNKSAAPTGTSASSDLKNFFYYEKKKVEPEDGGYFDYTAVGKTIWSEDCAKKKETINPSYFRFPMVFRCQLVNRNLFLANHRKISEKVKRRLTLFLERDSTYDKCKHAIKVVCQVQPAGESGSTVE